MTRHTRRVGLTAAAALATTLLALTGCTVPDDSGSPDAAGYSDDAIATFTDYTGGVAGEATGDPIKVGWINSQGGASDYTPSTVAADAAVKLINEQLGGVGGRPIELVKCFVGDSEEQGQVCAQEFVNDAEIVGVVSGSLVGGNATYHQARDGQVPQLGSIATDAIDASAANAYYLASGQFGLMGVVTYAAEYLEADTVAMTAPAGIAVVQQLTAGLTANFEAAGITVTQSTYDLGSTDFSAPLLASGAADADMFLAITGAPNQCIGIAQGLASLGITTPTLGFDTCLSEDVKTALGDYPAWTYQGQAVNVAAGSSDPETQAQIAAFEEWIAAEGAEGGQNSALTLQVMLTMAHALNNAGDEPTRESLGDALAAFTGPAFLGLGELSFNAIPDLPAIGTFGTRVYSYAGNGEWVDETDGEVVQPPAG